MESSLDLADEVLEQEGESKLSDEYFILHIIESILEHLDKVLYRKHIIQMTQTTVLDALENALYDFVNLYHIGETFASLSSSETFHLENDTELKVFSKDSLQL